MIHLAPVDPGAFLPLHNDGAIAAEAADKIIHHAPEQPPFAITGLPCAEEAPLQAGEFAHTDRRSATSLPRYRVSGSIANAAAGAPG